MLKENSVDVNTVLYDLLMGIILSTIFYFVVDYYPHHRRKLAGYRLIQLPISNVLASMETILSITKSVYAIDGELKNFVLRDWKVMFNNDDSISRQFVLYISSEKNRKCRMRNSYHIPAPVISPRTLNDVVRYELKTIKKNLDEIFTYESYFADDMKLFEYLTKLRNSSLFENYIETYSFNYMSDTYIHIYEIQVLFFNLSKYNIHYYNRNSIIDTSEKASRYQQKFNSGRSMDEWHSFMKKKSMMMSETDRVTYYKPGNHEEYIAKELANDFDTKLIAYTTNDNSLDLDNDMNIIVANVFECIKIILRRNFNGHDVRNKLAFFVIDLKFLGLFLKRSMVKKITSWNITLFFIPSSFTLFGNIINKENPTVNNIGIIRQAIDKELLEKFQVTTDE